MGYIEEITRIISKICGNSGQEDRYAVFTSYIEQVKSQNALMNRPVLHTGRIYIGAGKLTFDDPAAGARASISKIVSVAIEHDIASILSAEEKELLRPLLSDTVEKELFGYHYATEGDIEKHQIVHRFRSRELREAWLDSVADDVEARAIEDVPSVEIPKQEPKYWLWAEVEKGHEILFNTEEVIERVRRTGKGVRIVDPNVYSRQVLGYMRKALDDIDLE